MPNARITDISCLPIFSGISPADCTLLFGAYRLEAFPVDVWMKKCLSAMYPDGIPDFVRPYAGIAQQYLFHYSRTSGIFD